MGDAKSAKGEVQAVAWRTRKPDGTWAVTASDDTAEGWACNGATVEPLYSESDYLAALAARDAADQYVRLSLTYNAESDEETDALDSLWRRMDDKGRDLANAVAAQLATERTKAEALISTPIADKKADHIRRLIADTREIVQSHVIPSERHGPALTAEWATISMLALNAERLLNTLTTQPSVDKVRDALQAKIDELMLEYCPDEMTEEQIAEWGRHQQRVPPDEEARINAAIGKNNNES